MAYGILKETKDGQRFYEIRQSRGRGKAYLTTRWYIPDGWSQKAIERELNRQCVEFERKVESGAILSRAEEKERAMMEAAEAAKIQTLHQYAEKVFMPSLAVRCSEHTRDTFQRSLDLHILPVLGAVKLPEVTSAQITALLTSAQSGGNTRSKNKGLKHGSVIKLYTILNMLFKMAYMDETIDRNPMDRVQRPKPTKAEGKGNEIQAYTGEELKHILDCLEDEPLKWRLFIRLLIDTGCRRGEALGLTWKTVDFKENTITIEKNLCYSSSKGIYVDTPKNGRSRTIYVDPVVMKLMKEYRAAHKVITLDGYVFTQDDSTEPMHPDSPTRYFQRFGKRNGIPDFHPHKLRHSFASVAITNGADIASVSEKLGHADKSTTLNMYTHADAESQKRASEIFRQALEKGT